MLVGTSGSGKTTLRRELLGHGLPQDLVISLDDLLRESRSLEIARSRAPRALQDYSALVLGWKSGGATRSPPSVRDMSRTRLICADETGDP